MYCFAVVGSTLGANKNHIGVFSANGSGKVFEVWRVVVAPHVAAAVVGTKVSFVLARTTTAGTGAAAVVRKMDPAEDNMPAGISGSHTYTVQPTVTADSELTGAAVNTEETVTAVGAVEVFQADPERGVPPIAARANSGVVVRQAGLAGAGSVNVFIYGRVKNG